MASNKKAISTSAAPQAIGTYSQAIACDGLLFVSGQIPLDPATMELVPGGIEQQTRRVLDNLGAIASAAGATLDDALKINISITDLQGFASVNEVMAEYFAEPYPARACVQVAALPRGALIEIEAVIKGRGGI